MAQQRYTRTEIMSNPEIAKEVNETLAEFSKYILDHEFPDVIAIADFMDTYFQDMLANKDDGLAELRYVAVCKFLSHRLVKHIQFVREAKEMLEKSLGKSLQEMFADELGIEEAPAKSASPFKNRKFLN